MKSHENVMKWCHEVMKMVWQLKPSRSRIHFHVCVQISYFIIQLPLTFKQRACACRDGLWAALRILARHFDIQYLNVHNIVVEQQVRIAP